MDERLIGGEILRRGPCAKRRPWWRKAVRFFWAALTWQPGEWR